ncbi:MAG TPA: glycosyl hydrolase 115 family protein [Verrucomicrobiae bacterium]|nr:glycosyl hydrolase 115 family protein [Verrucomicrobiae bacterium]
MTARLLLAAGLVLAAGVAGSHGADVSLSASDAQGTSSFNAAGNWDNGRAPNGTNTYVTAAFTLRSPANTVSYTFAGSSLRIDAGGRFLMKGPGGQTVTISNLILNGGLADFANAGNDYYLEMLAGGVMLQAGTLSYMGALSGSPDFETLWVTAPITGSGSLQLGGPNVNAGADNGVVIFAGTNSYTGTTTVAGGTLLINAPNGPGNLIVTNGGTLGGTGSCGGTLSVLAGGKIAPGIPARGPLTASLATFTASNAAMIAGNVMMRIDRSGAPTNDRLAAPSITVNPGATLTVTNVGPTNLFAGDTFALFSAPITGAFSTLNLPTLPSPAMIWTNKLALNGTIAIVATNLVAVGAARPPVVAASQPALLTVAMTPAANPPSTGITVTANLTPVGGSAVQTFYDDGTHGDITAGDSVFSFNVAVPSNTSPGSLLLTAGVSDAQGRSASLKIALTVVASGAPFWASSFLPLSDTNGVGSLPLVAGGQSAPIYYSANDATVVGIAASALRDDVQRVTGVTPPLSTNTPAATTNAVFVGTIGQSALIDGLIAAGKINVSSIQGQWESYLATVVTNPVAGVSRALVIAGSDRRGTAFGVFGLSEAIGVSPWYWFGDVPVMPRAALYVGAGTYTEPSPGVKYRGIFLNDEDWGLNPWAEQVFDPSGQIGPTAYARIFELLLRLRANYIWPAMHNVTKAFYTVPGNQDMAENYAIVVGTSHHEPMLRNTSEYNPTTLGAYNYWTNRANIYSFWEQRVIETATNETIYTVGMRGLGDDAMITPPGLTTQQKADELENFIIPDQRQMISDHVNPNPALVPQVFVPYKEALVLYQTGMQVPDDITLCWPDDNHGYIRQLSSAAERARSGGSGVYYHLSYWGPPKSYLWLLTTPPAMTCEEMMKAWDYQARRLWIANVGDLKPGEIGMEFFLRLAWNPEAFRNFDQHAYLAQWAARNFGATNAEAIATLLEEYYRLNISARPEQLNFTTSGFSLISNGDEAQLRLDQFAALTASANALYAQLPANQKATFYEMILYPIRGADLQNQKVLLAERGRLWAAQGRAATTNLALAAQAAQNAIFTETAFYNQTNAGGKWNRTMTVTTTGEAKAPYIMPTLGSHAAPAAAGLGVAVEGSANVLGTNTGVLPTFNLSAGKSYFIDVFNTGTSAMSWTAQSSAPWITLTQTNGSTDARIWVGIDWAGAPRGYAVPGTVTIRGAGVTNTVNVKAFYPLSLNLAALPPAVENNGVVTIEAENYTSRQDSTNGVGWRKLTRACASRDGMTILPVTTAAIDPGAITSNTPSLTYQFHTFGAGAAVVQVGCLPTHKITSDHVGCRYAVSLNGDTPQIIDINADENSSAWSANVLRAMANGRSSHTIANPGLQTLKVWMVDPGVVLDKVTVTINSGVFEAEHLDFVTSGPYHAFSESGLSGDGAVSLDATGIGQYITFTLPHLDAGIYDLTVHVKAWNNRGIAQMAMGNSVNGPFVNLGGPLDFYTASVAYTNLVTLRFTNATAGPKYLKFTVTGKNASSSSYQVVLDNFTFVPVTTSAVAPSLGNWRMAFFGTTNNAGDAADAADPDHDGIPNLLEYAMGSYPTVSNGTWLAAAITNNHLAVTFNRARDQTDVSLRVKAASSLVELISGGTEIWSSAVAPDPGGLAPAAPVTVIDPEEMTNTARFLRLSVAHP